MDQVIDKLRVIEGRLPIMYQSGLMFNLSSDLVMYNSVEQQVIATIKTAFSFKTVTNFFTSCYPIKANDFQTNENS